MAAALASLGLEGVANAEGEGSGTAAYTGDESAFQAQALPTIIPGARVGVANFVEAQALNNAPGATRQYLNFGVWNTSGWLNIALDLPVGARLLRVDAYVTMPTTGTQSATFKLNQSVAGGSVTTLTAFATAGNNTLQVTHNPVSPMTVAPGARLFLETTSCNAPDKVFLGAVYQYYDANPQLNLLPTPIRVYDSRPGANPTTVAKGTLADSATRVIDCKFGGAVPAGAAAAMVTLTLTGTSTGGFMGLWRNGLADPGTSSINWDHSGTNVAVTTVVALDAVAQLIAKVGPNASTNFIIDVIGFYA